MDGIAKTTPQTAPAAPNKTRAGRWSLRMPFRVGQRFCARVRRTRHATKIRSFCGRRGRRKAPSRTEVTLGGAFRAAWHGRTVHRTVPRHAAVRLETAAARSVPTGSRRAGCERRGNISSEEEGRRRSDGSIPPTEGLVCRRGPRAANDAPADTVCAGPGRAVKPRAEPPCAVAHGTPLDVLSDKSESAASKQGNHREG